MIDQDVEINKWWLRYNWKCFFQLKVCMFGWLLLHNRILTWDNLRRKGWFGPGFCVLCEMEEENS